MLTLNNIAGTKRKKLRIGRGIGSGKGKTSGRGVKGQKSRSGVAIKSFEGGQMPLYRRLPKRGFNPIKGNYITSKINLGKIQYFIKEKKIDSKNLINLEYLKKANIINKKYTKLKILGSGDISDKVTVEANSFSKSAKNKLEKTGSIIQISKK